MENNVENETLIVCILTPKSESLSGNCESFTVDIKQIMIKTFKVKSLCECLKVETEKCERNDANARQYVWESLRTETGTLCNWKSRVTFKT